ncbi:hypothetical protein B0H17DRAFT_21060 [Mycena rosella]|uniref:Uncharacterized protein n=1 Tax=Mycena rosella TaxID=1033263 RepID=A0AAD7D8T7_MYCRO|nr:hypothetical protein B0H17DRAFT_21060 [Mycena rosella]
MSSSNCVNRDSQPPAFPLHPKQIVSRLSLLALFPIMSSSSGYFTHLIQVCWSFLLSIFSSRHRKRSSLSPELPTSLAAKREERDAVYDGLDAVYDGLGSWQRDKQQFLRRPSLIKAGTAQGTRTRETRKKKSRTMAPPPPEIYVQDWSSLRLNMADMFDSPYSAMSRSGAVESSVLAPSHAAGVELPTISEGSSLPSSEDPATIATGSLPSQSNDIKMVLAVDLPDLTEAHSEAEARSNINPNQETQEAGAQETSGVAAESATFSTNRYASNVLSAVPASFGTHFVLDPSLMPLPTIPAPSTPRLQSTPGGRDSILPYPDLFDFSMYARRTSQDSFCDTVELPSMDLSVSESSGKKTAEGCRPISIYDVVRERDRYRSAAYSSCLQSVCTSSPRRPPFASTLNLGAGRDTVDLSCAVPKKSALEDVSVWNGETTKDSIGAQSWPHATSFQG